MTAKMLSRQATKAHKESEQQKAKVKKVSFPKLFSLSLFG